LAVTHPFYTIGHGTRPPAEFVDPRLDGGFLRKAAVDSRLRRKRHAAHEHRNPPP